MGDLAAELERARALDVASLADAIEELGFECTRCGACCRGDGEEHTATVFPDEVRAIRDGDAGSADEWRDVARPMPFGLTTDDAGDPAGETFEWALQTDACGDCTFYDDGSGDGAGTCTVYADRPLICETYPFSVSSGEAGGHSGGGIGTTEPMGDVVDRVGAVRAHECEGLGREISREDALDLARTLKQRAVRELVEAIRVAENYRPMDGDGEGVVVHDSEGQKGPGGAPLDHR